MLQLQSIESFHIGGHLQPVTGKAVQAHVLAQGAGPRPVDPNGDFMVGQLYGQLYKQTRPVCNYPVVLWHGGGMTGASWETTPDGRDGWLQMLLAAGFDVCVCDAVERGRASWSLWPDVYERPAISRSMQEGWDMFRMGHRDGYHTDSRERRAHPGQKFPTNAYDQFARQWVPRWSDHEQMTMSAYHALLERVGPCLLIGHSQGGGFALQAACRWPTLIKALVALEPSGAPDHAWLNSDQPRPPHLVVWGDYIDDHPQWLRYKKTVDAHCRALGEQGTSATTLLLQSEGLSGHSHFPMMDLNNQAVLDLILQWHEQL